MQSYATVINIVIPRWQCSPVHPLGHRHLCDIHNPPFWHGGVQRPPGGVVGIVEVMQSL